MLEFIHFHSLLILMLLSNSFSLGPLTFHWYGFFISLGIVAAIIYAYFQAARSGEKVEHVINMAIIVVPLGIIGARLYHVIDHWSYYSQNLPAIIGGQGLGIFGAVIGGATGVLIYAAWKKLPPLKWTDIIAPGLILAQAIGRWGNFFNQELYGHPTDLPWGIFIDPVNRAAGYEAFTHFHPLFLYESLWNLAGFGILLYLSLKHGKKLLVGEITMGYIMYYSVGRFILEGMKLDVWTIGGIPTARWITGIAFLVALGIVIYRRWRLKHEPQLPEEA